MAGVDCMGPCMHKQFFCSHSIIRPIRTHNSQFATVLPNSPSLQTFTFKFELLQTLTFKFELPAQYSESWCAAASSCMRCPRAMVTSSVCCQFAGLRTKKDTVPPNPSMIGWLNRVAEGPLHLSMSCRKRHGSSSVLCLCTKLQVCICTCSWVHWGTFAVSMCCNMKSLN
jgi:hypothetical protein